MSGGRGLASCALLAALLAACGGSEELEGRGYLPPSEVTAARTVPLTVPPDYGLRPEAPEPAEGGMTVIGAEQQPTGIEVAALDVTPGEQTLMMKAGVPRANPKIRSLLQRENAIFAGDPAFVEELLYGDFPEAGSVTVEEGPDVAADIVIEQQEIEEEGWLDGVMDIF